MNKNTELKNEVGELLQFIITLNIFFISIIEILFRYVDSSMKQMTELELKWMASVAILIVCFLLFKIFKKSLSDFILKFSKTLILLDVFLFIIPLIILATQLNSITNYLSYYFLRFSLYGLVVLPIILLFVLIIGQLIFLLRKK